MQKYVINLAACIPLHESLYGLLMCLCSWNRVVSMAVWDMNCTWPRRMVKRSRSNWRGVLTVRCRWNRAREPPRLWWYASRKWSQTWPSRAPSGLYTTPSRSTSAAAGPGGHGGCSPSPKTSCRTSWTTRRASVRWRARARLHVRRRVWWDMSTVHGRWLMLVRVQLTIIHHNLPLRHRRRS